MLIRLGMELEDVPGQLVRVLEPISRFGGNIQSVVHQRERKTPLGMAPVMVIFDVDERARLNKIISALRAMGTRITHVGERAGISKSTVLLLGDVLHTDINGTIEVLNSLRGVAVSDLSLAMGEAGRESAARLTIVGDDESSLLSAISRLERIAAEKKLLLVKSVGE